MPLTLPRQHVAVNDESPLTQKFKGHGSGGFSVAVISVSVLWLFVLSSQLALKKFSRWAFGNFFNEPNRLGALVIGQSSAAKGADFLFSRFPAPFEYDERGDLFAVKLIRQADGCRSGDRRMLIQNFVDLARIDIFTAAYDHVAFAIDDVEEAVSVAIANVARVKPAVAKRGRGCFRIPVVAFENVFAAQDNFAEFSIGHFIVLVVEDFHLVSDRHAAGAGPPLLVGGIES